MGEGWDLVSIMDSRCLSYASVLEAKGCLTLLFKLREIGIFFVFYVDLPQKFHFSKPSYRGEILDLTRLSAKDLDWIADQTRLVSVQGAFDFLGQG